MSTGVTGVQNKVVVVQYVLRRSVCEACVRPIVARTVEGMMCQTADRLPSSHSSRCGAQSAGWVRLLAYTHAQTVHTYACAYE